MKLLVTGSRHGRLDVEHYLDRWARKFGEPHWIVLGCALGVDRQALLWAIERGYFFVVRTADWERFGKQAGSLRNADMAAMIGREDYALAFPLAEAKGTRNCMQHCRQWTANVFECPLRARSSDAK